VHWPVQLSRVNLAEGVETTTRDLSSEGLYCYSRSPFTTGETIHSIISVPGHDASGRVLRLRCRLRVLRVERDGTDGQYGIACRIEDYQLG